MIRYRLRCGEGHAFDGWFRSSADFEAQRGTDALLCPDCGSPEVDRALMAPAIARGGARAAALADEPAPADAPARRGGESVPGRAEADPRRAMFAAFREAVRRVRREAQDVGAAFPDEARRIHRGEAEERAIRGEASPEEARSLLEEGVPVLPLPDLPDDLH